MFHLSRLTSAKKKTAGIQTLTMALFYFTVPVNNDSSMNSIRNLKLKKLNGIPPLLVILI